MSGCTELNSHSRHWPCLSPQHGRAGNTPGRSHCRRGNRRSSPISQRSSSADRSTRTEAGRPTGSCTGPRTATAGTNTRAISSPTSQRTSSASSRTRLNASASSGGGPTATTSRSPRGSSWHCWTSSLGRSTDRSPPARSMEVRAGRRPHRAPSHHGQGIGADHARLHPGARTVSMRAHGPIVRGPAALRRMRQAAIGPAACFAGEAMVGRYEVLRGAGTGRWRRRCGGRAGRWWNPRCPEGSLPR